MPFPFEVPFEMVAAALDAYVDEVFGALGSEFLTLPKGAGFLDYPVFEQGYQELKRATGGFRDLSADAVADAVFRVPVVLIVLRTILGFTPPEWAFLTSQRSGVEVSQGAARAIDRAVRMKPLAPMRRNGGVVEQRVRALVVTACQLLREGAPQREGNLHRLDKADTRHGVSSLQSSADLGLPYAMVLYERFLGRPFAGHRDSVSELVGDVLESAIESALAAAGIGFRKTKRAQRVPGFDQAPDFIVPDEFNPRVVLEAKIAEDDGTARDKVTRVQHLGALSTQGVSGHAAPRFEVIACIAGRGFGVRREDMKNCSLPPAAKSLLSTISTGLSIAARSRNSGPDDGDPARRRSPFPQR